MRNSTGPGRGGLKGAVGTYSLYLSWLMHMVGIFGAVQNLLDTLVLSLTELLAWQNLRRYDLPAVTAAAMRS
jgi:hypothetical protein